MIEQNLLPNLLIIGAAKAGTSALHVYLNEHPQIFMTKPKEPRFFLVWENQEQMRVHEKENRPVFNAYNTLEKYTALFAEGKYHPIRGESSPQYLSYLHCAAKISKLIPNVKIIAVLRNPVDRAFSNYVMYKNWRVEKKNFEEAIEEELKNGRLSCIQDLRYLSLGKYVEQLKPYLSLFPANQLKICLYDDFKTSPENFLKDIFDFLGVDNTFIPKIETRHNVSFIRRYAEKPKIDKLLNVTRRGFRKLNITFLERAIQQHRFYKPLFKAEVRKKIINYYVDEISQLERLLNKDLSGWRK